MNFICRCKGRIRKNNSSPRNSTISTNIFFYENKQDGFPTLNLKNAVKDQNKEPILYQAVYSSSSYGTKDLPKVFEYSLSKATQFYKENCNNKDKILDIRLEMVNNILYGAYVNDIGIHEFRNSLFTYFITSYDDPGNILKVHFQSIQNPDNINSTQELLKATSQLSSLQFDEFLKDLSNFCAIQITQDINKVLSYCNFYLKEWISFDQTHKNTLNKDLPKEGSTSNILRQRPLIADTHTEIRKIQNTQNSADTDLIKEENTSITQLGRNLSQWTYSVKNKTVGFQIKHTKINFKTFEKAEQYLTNNNITKGNCVA